MAIDKFLLEILVCPESKQKVSLADDDLIAKLNQAVASGKLRNRAGEPVTERFDAALVREDGQVAFPVRDDIPVMLVDEGVPLDQVC